MSANELLAGQIDFALLTDAIGNPASGGVDITMHAEIENGYSTGYELLHDTNANLGDLRIVGSRTAFGGSEFRYDVSVTWNDRMDPNFQYAIDILATAFSHVVADPAPYNIHITWQETRVFWGYDR